MRIFLLACAVALFGATASAADLGPVEDQFFTIRDFRLHNGVVMPEVKIAYETYGKLAPDGRNAVLIAHGYTSSHHAAGYNPANGNNPGWWNGLIGPGKAIDTDRLFVVASNMLGSSFGSTNGASLNPATGKPYGPDFPAITVRATSSRPKRRSWRDWGSNISLPLLAPLSVATRPFSGRSLIRR